jgi:peptidoglycan/xylan/chitin deacetylase (PgdA/CDA1 family)
MRWLYSDAVFRKENDSKTVFLTFDDGPSPKATPTALEILREHGVKATFFLLGKRAEEQPEIVAQIREEGHQVANHGYRHLSGWTTSLSVYVENTLLGKKAVNSGIFRPPYGTLGYLQYLKLKRTEKIVFWDVLSGDHDTTLSPEAVYKNVVNNVRNGSVIVMHDSDKALPNVKNSLGRIIVELKNRGYNLDTL